MTGWATVKLGTIANFKNGLNFNNENWGAGLKIIGVSDFKNRMFPDFESLEQINPRGVARDQDLLEQGDVVFVRSNGNRALIGRCLYINELPEPVSHSGFTIRLRFIDKRAIHAGFFVYVFKSDLVRQVLSDFGGGTNINNLNQGILQNLEVPLPSLQVQRKIAAILSAYDDLIANNQRRITLLESMAEEIYREWFVRMRFPDHQQVQRFKGLPSSWTLKSFKDFCVLKRGYDLPDGSMQPGHYPVIASTSIKGFHNEFKVNPPVITTGRSGSLGTVLLVNKKSWPLNTALYVKDFCGNSPFLIYYTLRSLKLETFNVGAGVPTLNRNHLASLGIAVPDAALQRHFDAILGPMNAQASMLAEVNEKLTAQRDALLPRLISGKLKVDHLDIQFPPSMREKVTA